MKSPTLNKLLILSSVVSLAMAIFLVFDIYPKQERWPLFILIIVVLLTLLVFEPFFRSSKRPIMITMMESDSRLVQYTTIGVIGLLALFQFFAFAFWVMLTWEGRFGGPAFYLLCYFFSVGLFYSVAILCRYSAPKQ